MNEILQSAAARKKGHAAFHHVLNVFIMGEIHIKSVSNMVFYWISGGISS